MGWLLRGALGAGGEGLFHEIADTLLSPHKQGTTLTKPGHKVAVPSRKATKRRFRNPAATDVFLNLSDEFFMIAHREDDSVMCHTSSSKRWDASHLFGCAFSVGYFTL